MSNDLLVRKFYVLTFAVIILFSAELFPQQSLKSAHLDHLTIAVPELIGSSRYFRDTLGFTIKMGRLHANSIENNHIKFTDKSSIELLTAKSPIDDLASWYINYLKQFPDGAGAFLGIRIENENEFNRIEELASELRLDYSRVDFKYSDIIYFGENVPINTMFFIRYKVEIKDRAAELKHKNTCMGLNSVCINSEQPVQAAELLEKFGFELEDTKDLLIDYPVEKRFFIGGRPVYLVDSDREERIAGVSIKCTDLITFRKGYRNKTGTTLHIKEGYDYKYILLDKIDACGMWIEFAEKE